MRQRRLIAVTAALAAVVAGAAPALAGPSPAGSARHRLAAIHRLEAGDDNGNDEPGGAKVNDGSDEADGASQFAQQRTAPGDEVPAAAVTSAYQAGTALPATGGQWTQLTSGTYNNDATGFADPFWSDYGAGWENVSGRTTALATDGNWLYAGGADGGVWVSADHGAHWTPTFQNEPTLSIGSLWVNPADHALWVGTGEANTSSDSYAGQGVWVSADHGRSYQKVGGGELGNALIFSLRAGDGYLFAATSHGLWRRSLRAPVGSPWQLVLKPDPNTSDSPYDTSFITDVAIRPGSDQVLAVLGWRLGTAYNGFYLSGRDGAPGSFAKIAPTGIDNSDVGRTSLSYAPSGNALYAVIQSPDDLNNGPPAPAESTSLKGVYESKNGDPDGPWTLIADSASLAASGSGLTFPSTYEPGIQSWYDQYVDVDPSNPSHIYLGLEEIFESTDGGATWHTIGPYWNFNFACYTTGTCPPTTHPDQHGIAFGPSGAVYFGSDGGVWSRSDSTPATERDFTDLNDTLHTLQYYNAHAGLDPQGGTDVWGGMQDNGTGLLSPALPQMVEPIGGDGGDTIVNPTNAYQSVGEYTDMAIASTTDEGRSDGTTNAYTTISPACDWNPDMVGCDPNPQFITPLKHDEANLNDWITAGQFVWVTTKGWSTTCTDTACDWADVYDLGSGRSATAVDSSHGVAYVGWCGACNPASLTGTGFASGIATNYGGTWHQIIAPNLPNRWVSDIVADPANPSRVFAVYGGYSRHWIPGGGVGHVFESTDGGKTWTDVSGNLPDVPGDALVLWHGMLVAATDSFVYATPAGRPGRWTRLGAGLPNVVADDIALYPSGNTLVVATHGRGLWVLRS